ncbi:MAG TPA: PQQ-binding-like beta-propeller repeat protein [Pyrinomonadaceae bacterium]|nr:PQQ-binding-like beta-propeller repeat protein [Pyrinomonadaceae bacterium]
MSRKDAKMQKKDAQIKFSSFAPLRLYARAVAVVLCATLPLIGSRASADVLLSQPLTVRWRYQSDVTLNLTPAFDNERVYLPLAGGTIVALKAKDGQLYWRSEIGGELSASPVADESAIYVASETVGKSESPAGALRALGREGGVTQWMTPLVRPLRGALTISGDKIFAGGSDGRAYAFDKRTGGALWSIPFASPFNGQPVAKDGKVYFGSEDGTLLALEETTGRVMWRYRTKGPVRGPVAVLRNNVFFGSGDGYVYSVSSDKGRLKWRKRTGAGVEAVVLVRDALLAASLDNFAYLLDLDGSQLWKKQLPGRISAQPLTVEEAALFTPLSSEAAVVLGLKDGKQVNSLPTGEELSSASPIIVGDAVILTTEHGLLAFAHPTDSTLKRNYE